MRVLVTGATGFVGRHLVPELRQHEVTCIVRDASRAADLSDAAGTALIEGDLTDPSLARRLPPRMDAVVHVAQAYVPFPSAAAELFAVNAASTVWLAEYAREAGVGRFVYTSSGSVYAPSRMPLSESTQPSPLTFHPATKLMSEIALRHYRSDFSVAVLRLFGPYGPGQVNRLIPRLVDSVRSGSPITLSRGGEPRINPIYVVDLVRVLEAALADSRSYTVNVGGPQAVSIRDMAEIIAMHLGRSPDFLDQDGEVEGDLVADTTLMHELFGVGELIVPREGLGRMIGAGVMQAS